MPGIPDGLLRAARQQWDDRYTLSDARGDNPEYLRGQVETIANLSTLEPGEDFEAAKEFIAGAIFAEDTVTLRVTYQRAFTDPDSIADTMYDQQRPGGVLSVEVVR